MLPPAPGRFSLPHLAEPCGDDPGQRVEGAAGAEGDDHADGLVGISLRGRRRWRPDQQARRDGERRAMMQKSHPSLP
jgi:hypothetical protein